MLSGIPLGARRVAYGTWILFSPPHGHEFFFFFFLLTALGQTAWLSSDLLTTLDILCQFR
jgi:hypothetical protein